MPKYIVVKVPDGTTNVCIHSSRKEGNCIFSDAPQQVPILHGKRELLEKVLEVGEFDVAYEPTKEAKPWLGMGAAGGGLELRIGGHFRQKLVLTNLDDKLDVDAKCPCPMPKDLDCPHYGWKGICSIIRTRLVNEPNLDEPEEDECVGLTLEERVERLESMFQMRIDSHCRRKETHG